MKDSAIAPEIADPYAALETILKIIGRSWLSEEWRLEDVRLLAQEALAARSRAVSGKGLQSSMASPGLPFKTAARNKTTDKPRDGMSS